MKTYEKPTITLVSLTANSGFCNCQADMDDIWDLIPGIFNDECKVDVDTIDISDYCKYGSSGELAFTS